MNDSVFKVGDIVWCVSNDGFATAVIIGINGEEYTFVDTRDLKEFKNKLSDFSTIEPQEQIPPTYLHLSSFNNLNHCLRKAKKYEQYGIKIAVIDDGRTVYKTGDPIEVSPYVVPENIIFYHWSDPNVVQPNYAWHFIYLHGKAEYFNQSRCGANDWYWNAPDLILSNVPIPEEPGEYRAKLYGKDVIAVLADRHGWMSGRACFEDDLEALAHCRDVAAWR